MTCEWHHEDDGWLPVRGTEDAVYLEDNGVEYEYLLLLIPTEYRRCFCSDTDNLPEGAEFV